ncbi:MAG: DUF1786 domain-containing protein [Syntrophobacteraceae bacterium]|nr:DUF1786 domain-containing protein [Syntrophobacteraceae bacterium]
MSRCLLVDIGAGTMDVLCFDDESGLNVKAVARSPALEISERASVLPGDLLVTGKEMGGGSLARILAKRSETSEVVMSASASMTVHHHVERVRAMGVRVVEDAEAQEIKASGRVSHLHLEDLNRERLEKLVTSLGIPFEFDVLGVCAQDHGTPPKGVSHLDYRHRLFQEVLDGEALPHALLFADHEVPSSFNRVCSIAERAEEFPASDVYVMDSGMAAILGAAMDPEAQGAERFLVLDVATSHTVGAALLGLEVAGFFEYHTHDITLERLEALLVDLAEGRLSHQQILAEGGHGAYVRRRIGYKSVECIVATGPKRSLMAPSGLPIVWGAPFGDNMMTGTVGLLQAIRLRQGLDPVFVI